MKKLLFTIAMATLWGAQPLICQTQTRTSPDCLSPFSFTATGVSADLNNIPQTASGASTGGCSAWIISVEGFNSASGSVTFQQAPSNTAGTAPGSYVTFVPLSGTTSLGANPVISFPGSYITTGYAPWLRVSVTVSAGTIRGTIQGWRSLSAARSGGGGGSSFYQTVADEGSSLPQEPILNFKGAGVTCVDNSGSTRTDCTIPGGATSAYATIQNAGVPVAQQSVLNFVSGVTCVNNGGTSATDCTATASGGGIASYSAPAVTLPAAGTTFFPPGGGGLPSGTETNVQGASPVATISKFYVQLSANIGGGNTIAFTFRKAGSDQSVTCTISGTNNACNDTTHTFNVAAGDLVSIKAITTGTVIIAPTVVIMYNTGGGGGGSGSTTSSGTFAALPTAGTTGNMYLFSNSAYNFARDNGVSWDLFFQGHQLTAPTGFAWQNQTTATVTTTFGGEVIMSAVGAGGVNLNGRFVAYPATPFTRTLAVLVNPLVVNNSVNPSNGNGGLYISDGTAVEAFSAYGLSTMQIQFGPSMTNITTNLTTFPLYTALFNNALWLRYGDDGVTRTFSYSFDGSNFTIFFSEASGTNLTPTRIGYYAGAFESGTQVKTWALGWQ